MFDFLILLIDLIFMVFPAKTPEKHDHDEETNLPRTEGVRDRLSEIRGKWVEQRDRKNRKKS